MSDRVAVPALDGAAEQAETVPSSLPRTKSSSGRRSGGSRKRSSKSGRRRDSSKPYAEEGVNDDEFDSSDYSDDTDEDELDVNDAGMPVSAVAQPPLPSLSTLLDAKPDLEGVLWKKGARVGMWVKRYFRLYGPRLSYYLKAKDDVDRPRGTLNLVGTEITCDIKGDRGKFVIKINSYHRTMIVRADSEASFRQWSEAVQKQCGESNLSRQTVQQPLLTSKLRKLVSRNKKRFQEDDFDLDLTYITPRMIAMGFPSENIEGLYRNPMSEVQRFLEHYHKDHYMVYNLCSEREYPHNKFNNRVVRMPFDDHHAPPLEMISDFCNHVVKWMAQDPKNITAIHCKAGKGRTGVMIASWLMHVGICTTPDEALRSYGKQRAYDGKGVTIPSQRRFVYYYAHVLKHGRMEKKPFLLKSIVMHTTPDFDTTGGCQPIFRIWCNGKRLFQGTMRHTRNAPTITLNLKEPVRIVDNVRVDCRDKETLGANEPMWNVWFHTSFIEGNSLTFLKSELDKAEKDKKNVHFKPEFKVEFIVEPVMDSGKQKSAGDSA